MRPARPMPGGSIPTGISCLYTIRSR
jgi:hypothetical protein